MYKNYINLENFNHKLVIIFLEDGKMVSPMSFPFLGSGKMALDTWWLHHGGSIPCDHMVSPKGLFLNSLAGFTKSVNGSGIVCDQTSKFFVFCWEESMAGHVGVNGVY
jgi:hypothetical protein